MSGLPRMEMFQFWKSEGLVSFQKSCSNQITHYWSTFQLLVWFCKMNLKNLKSGSTKAYIFIVCLATFVSFCIFHQKDGLHNDQMRSTRVPTDRFHYKLSLWLCLLQ